MSCISPNSFAAYQLFQSGSWRRVAKNKAAKKLREVYKNDKEARAFLKKHPEFNGFEVETTRDAPSNASAMDRVPDSFKTERARTIQNALATHPDRKMAAALSAYYAGAELKFIAPMVNCFSNDAIKSYLKRARQAVYDWARAQTFTGEIGPLDSGLPIKELYYKGRRIAVVKLRDGRWAEADSGRIYNDGVHDALESLKWEMVDLGFKE